jgi:hypothetical protein
LDATTTGCFENAVLLPRPVLRVSYDEDIDFLCALVLGEAIDDHLDDETQPLAAMDDETEEEIAWLFTRGPNGPLIGFGIARAFEWPVAAEPDDAPIWHGPRFDVPTLALRNATIGEILLAAQTTITGSTTDVCLFDAAIAAKEQDGDLEQAEAMWRGCLEAGDMRAHFGLGYTLCDLGRPAEAFGHLAMYTDECLRERSQCGIQTVDVHRLDAPGRVRLSPMSSHGTRPMPDDGIARAHNRQERNSDECSPTYRRRDRPGRRLHRHLPLDVRQDRAPAPARVQPPVMADLRAPGGVRLVCRPDRPAGLSRPVLAADLDLPGHRRPQVLAVADDRREWRRNRQPRSLGAQCGAGAGTNSA